MRCNVGKILILIHQYGLSERFTGDCERRFKCRAVAMSEVFLLVR